MADEVFERGVDVTVGQSRHDAFGHRRRQCGILTEGLLDSAPAWLDAEITHRRKGQLATDCA
jgi:hypothetical protein